MQYKYFVLIVIALLLFSCRTEKEVELVIYNANLYPVDTSYINATAIAVKNGLIFKIGTDKEIRSLAGQQCEQIDAGGTFVMPGFIEGHGHYSGLGFSLIDLNFLQSRSWEEIMTMVKNRAGVLKPGEWIVGRGWHQEKWDSIPSRNIHNYPFHNDLSELTPDNPVILYHASGHALFANRKAMDLAGISKETADPIGGEIVRDLTGEASGVFEERAMALIRQKYIEYRKSLDQNKLDSVWHEAIARAEQECLSKGITSFQDAGSTFDELDKFEKMALTGQMKVRLWAMVRHNAEELENKAALFKKLNIGNNFYTCNAIKSEVDGALGAFGAWLLEPYSDKPGFSGQNTTDIYEVKRIADIALKNDMQFCVHAIGDRANRVVLDIYENMLTKQGKNKDMRWRIEHAQHLNPADIPRFAQFGIIASMQGIHCTSDAPFVVKRLGNERARFGAYAWRSLLDAGVVIANGTDAPVEDVNPLKSFYASVTRKREDSGFVFFPEQKMTRKEALYSYTLGNAYAAFEEKIKGSIRVGKLADLVIISHDLLNCTDEEVKQAKVLYTITDGKVRFSNPIAKTN